MRLIGLTLTFLVLVGLVQLVFDRQRLVETFLASYLEDQVQLVALETPTAFYYTSDLSGADVQDIVASDPNLHRSLTKFPDFTKLSFALPLSVETMYAAINLDLKTQLMPTSTGVVSVHINGKKRGEILIQDGSNEVAVRIPLEPQDLVKPHVEVALRTRGQSEKAVCSAEDGFGVVVEVLPTTHMDAIFGSGVGKFADQLARSGDPARIIWPTFADISMQNDVLEIAHNLSASDLAKIRFVAPEFRKPKDIDIDPDKIAEARVLVAPNQDENFEARQEQATSQWPVSVLNAPKDIQLKRFASEQVWTFEYRQADMPEGGLPSRLDFELALSGAADGEAFLLYISLNDALIHSENLDRTVIGVRREIDLPASFQKNQNVVKITLFRSEVKSHPCNVALPVVAQLKPGSVLQKGADAPRQPSAKMMSALSQASDISLSLGTRLRPSSANTAVLLLSQLLANKKVNVQYQTPSPEAVRIFVSTADELAAAYDEISRDQGSDGWIVWAAEGEFVAEQMNSPTARAMLTAGGSDAALYVYSHTGAGG